MIPKKIHQIWIGPNKIPNKCKEYSEHMKMINSNFEYFFWTDDNIPLLPELVKLQYERYYRMNKWAFASDVLRYYLIWNFGGIYVDIDFKANESLNDLINCNMFVVSPNTNAHWICNGIFGSIEKHPILDQIISTMKVENYHGPIYLSNEIKKYYNAPLGQSTSFNDLKILLKNDITLHSPENFFRKNGKYLFHDALKSWHKNYSQKNN